MYLKGIRELNEIKNRYANHLLLSVSVLGFIALLVSLKETLIHGWRLDSITDTIGFTIILTFYLFRKWISTESKIWALVIAALATGSAGLITNSVISMFAPYFMLSAIFVVIFFNLRITLLLVSYQILFILLIFLLKVRGIITYNDLDPYYRAFSNDNWLNYLATYIFFIILIVILSHSFYENLKQTTWTLKELNIQLQAEIEAKEKALFELRESNEMVAAAEDELRATNDELIMVNEELSKKNEELAKYHNYLEDLVKERTRQIYELNSRLTKTNNNLIESNDELLKQKEELATILEKLKKTQAELVQSEKMASLGVLTAGIAHEINNPINFISGGVYGLQILLGSLTEYIRDTKKLQKEKGIELNPSREKEIEDMIAEMNQLIENILTGVDRSTAIVKSLKIFSYAGSENIEQVNIHEGIDATLIMLQHIFKNRIKINKFYGDLPSISCNSSQINQVFMNILTNAIDSIKDTGEISVKTEHIKETNKILISISDTGEGIPVEIQAHIFEPFYTTKKSGKGTGLGLSISYNIIKEHGGDIYFESKSGTGTTFYIQLPVNHHPEENTIG